MKLYSNKLIEKYKPQKVLYEDVGYDSFHNENLFACICPSCGLHIIEFRDFDVSYSNSDNPKEMFLECLDPSGGIGLNNFCNRCGQRLDWK